MGKTVGRCIVALLLLILLISLAGCSSSTSESDKTGGQAAQPGKKVIKIACVSTIEPIIDWLNEGMAPLGYDVRTVMFDANQLPATALKDGDVDGVITNHLPWINTFNKENKCDLQMPQPYMYYSRTAVYSTKYKTVDAIPQNARIAVPGDPSNMDRSLQTLQDMGLITLDKKTGNFFTLLDIKDNPQNIKIIETEITQTVRSIHDVDAVITGGVRVKLAGLDPNVFLFEDSSNKNYPIGLVVNPKDLNADWVKAALKVSQSEEFKKKFNAHFNGTYVLYNN